jgi:3-isopropylmalate dehydratase small subunit
MRHYTTNSTGRYVIEESLSEVGHANGFNLGIQATTAEERKVISQYLAEESSSMRLQPVNNVVAYLEDSIESEAHKWENAKMLNGADAMTSLKEVITFLKAVKNQVSVLEFSLNDNETGMELTLVLVSPGVMAYYTRLDWTIV